MKKIIYMTGILLSVWSYGQQEKGVPLSGEFDGTRCNYSHGMCSVSQDTSGKAAEETKLSAKKISDNSFQLVVNRANLDPGEESRIVGKPFSSLDRTAPPKFVVEE